MISPDTYKERNTTHPYTDRWSALLQQATFEPDSFSSILDEFIGDRIERWNRQHGILEQLAREVHKGNILDLAAGSGADLVMLLRNGFRVTANEISPSFRRILRERLRDLSFTTEITAINWKLFGEVNVPSRRRYGLIYSLGNSFPTYLSSTDDISVCLRGFARILKPGGYLFFDTRNYDYLLSEWDSIVVNPINRFRYSARSTYLNSKAVLAFPYSVAGVISHFVWISRARLMYTTDRFLAVRRREMTEILERAGFAVVDMFYDYKRDFTSEYDFIQFLACNKS